MLLILLWFLLAPYALLQWLKGLILIYIINDITTTYFVFLQALLFLNVHTCVCVYGIYNSNSFKKILQSQYAKEPLLYIYVSFNLYACKLFFIFCLTWSNSCTLLLLNNTIKAGTTVILIVQMINWDTLNTHVKWDIWRMA